MGKFDVVQPQATDQDLVVLLATRGMGWALHNISGHRPGSRPVPHAWRWNVDGGVRIMVFVGGHGEAANVQFDPLNDAESAGELVKRLKTLGIIVDGWDLATADGRRSMCQAAAQRLMALPPPPEKKPTPPPASSPAKVAPGATPLPREYVKVTAETR